MRIKSIKNILANKYFILTLLTLFALFIRLLNIDKETGLWFDEMVTYLFASKSFPIDIIKSLSETDFHMTLHSLFVNLWINFFGSNDIILRLSSVLWGILTIPAFFYLGKTYKSEELGYLLAIIGTLSPVMIYYSQEVRFYSMLLFFATLSVIFFLKILEKNNNKELILFHIANLIILYTYTMGIIFVSIEILILFFHYHYYKRNEFKTLLKSFIIFLIFSIPYLSLLLYFQYESNHLLLDYFSWATLYNKYPILVINDYFSPFLANIYSNDYEIYLHYLNSPSKIFYLLLMLTPSFCFISGFIISLKNLHKKSIYILIIMTLFLMSEFTWWIFGTFIIMTKYTLIIFPMILLLGTDGLLSIKKTSIKYSLIGLIFLVFIYNIINYKNVVTFEDRPAGFLFPTKQLMKLQPNNDYLLILEGAKFYKKYIRNFNIIDFEGHTMFYLDVTKKEASKAFNKEFIESTSRKNALDKFKPYLTNPKPTKELNHYIVSQISKIPKGKRLIYVEGPYFGGRLDYESIYDKVLKDSYCKTGLFDLILEKIDIDIKNILKNTPSLIKIKTIELENKYTYNFLIYKKI